jgi:hypothetical protein
VGEGGGQVNCSTSTTFTLDGDLNYRDDTIMVLAGVM